MANGLILCLVAAMFKFAEMHVPTCSISSLLCFWTSFLLATCGVSLILAKTKFGAKKVKQGKIGHIFWLLWMFCLPGFVFSKVSSEMNNMGLPNTYLLVSGLSLITMLSVILGFEFTRHHKKLEKGEGIEVSFPDVTFQELPESVLRFISIALGFAIIIDYGGLGNAFHLCCSFFVSAFVGAQTAKTLHSKFVPLFMNSYFE